MTKTKLTPEGIIYGEATNQSGQPLERISVRAQAWRPNNGRRYLQTAAQTMTVSYSALRLVNRRELRSMFSRASPSTMPTTNTTNASAGATLEATPHNLQKWGPD